VAILLMVIGGFFIILDYIMTIVGYSKLCYHKLLVVILL
jgi:hypothetical protein